MPNKDNKKYTLIFDILLRGFSDIIGEIRNSGNIYTQTNNTEDGIQSYQSLPNFLDKATVTNEAI